MINEIRGIYLVDNMLIIINKTVHIRFDIVVWTH